MLMNCYINNPFKLTEMVFESAINYSAICIKYFEHVLGPLKALLFKYYQDLFTL